MVEMGDDVIKRYEIAQIANLWTDETKFKTYLDVEWAILKSNPYVEKEKLTDELKNSIKIDLNRIAQIEQEVHHDVVAFCTSIMEQLPDSIARWFHFGVTSSDIIDTATMLIIKKNLELILFDLKKLLETIYKRAIECKDIMIMGRSHGMVAEPMSLGQKWLGFYKKIYNDYNIYENLIKNEMKGAISGSVGNYTIVTPEMEQKALDLLGLKVEEISTQVIPRDRFARIILQGSILATNMESLCLEIRHLHRSEVAEVSEAKASKQKGSSTMPHKKNPISSENITGISRIIRSHSQVALENCLLWHERDISHSSAERMMLPDHFGLLSYSIRRLDQMMKHLIINKEKIDQNLRNNLDVYSSLVLHLLIIKKSTKTRDELYTFVQELFFHKKWNNIQELLEIIQEQMQVTIGIEELSFNNYTNDIFDRL